MLGATLRLCLAVAMVVLVTQLQVSQGVPDDEPTDWVDKWNNDSFTYYINELLQNYLSNISDPLVIEKPLELRLNVPYMADIELTMSNTELWGLQSLFAHNCTLGLGYSSGALLNETIVLNLKTPQLTIKTPAYVMNGTVVDHINLAGAGPASIIIDELSVGMTENGTISLSKLNFSDNATLDLEMKRWTVNFENLMPGTDLGTLFNEFFSAHGQELLDMFEIKFSESGKFVKLFNIIMEEVIMNIIDHITTRPPTTSTVTTDVSEGFTTP
ncbi:uncharacterized protein [Procambarus clarkii]|uniref:uncharacterized protein n=1 Tax=Procambarus clarkii TaxID=6728 RepID=UPI0037420DF1